MVKKSKKRNWRLILMVAVLATLFSFVLLELYLKFSLRPGERLSPEVRLRRECEFQAELVSGVKWRKLKQCYLRDLQVWVVCPSEELDKYNQALDECLKEKGIEEDPEWQPVL